MIHKKNLFVATALVLMLSVFVTTTAFAHFCTNPNKKDGAGSIGTYNVVTESFEAGKKVNDIRPNGGFVTFTDGATFWVDIYLHQLLPEGALASGPGGDDQCDGKGVDNFLACIGVAVE